MMKTIKIKRKANYTLRMAMGFLALIALGAVLLFLPISGRQHSATSPIDCIFTSASAVCVTGLTPFDVFTHWTLFGQIVILFLIQIGGLGFMTLISMFASFFKKSFSVTQKNLAMQSTGSMELGGLKIMLKKILAFTITIEFFGAAILAVRFFPVVKTFGKAVYFGIFHSVSAFCNAGFDLCGMFSPSSSLATFQKDVVVNLTVCILIIAGGLGFIVWDNVFEHKHRLSKYDFYSKTVLLVSGILIVFGTLFFFFSEKNSSMSNLGFSERLLASFFQSVTLRTAGFSTISQDNLSSGGYLISLCLMAIGGGSGSTAGGIKVTTFLIFILGMLSAIRGKREIRIFKRRFENDAIRQASAVIGLFSFFVIISTIIICAIDALSLKKVLFESVSAAANVGLSASLTPLLSTASKAVLAILMFCGRVGGFSLMLLIAKTSVKSSAHRPVGKVLIG